MILPLDLSSLRPGLALACFFWLAEGGTTFSQEPVEPSRPTNPKFAAKELAITAPELAEKLGYKFFGYSWQFSAPTYVRVEIYSESAEGDTPQDPAPSTKPRGILAFASPQDSVALRVIRHKTSVDERPGGPTDIKVEFDATLSGTNTYRDLRKGLDPLPQLVADILPDLLNSSAAYSQKTGMTFEDSITRGRRKDFSEQFRQGTGTFGQAFAQLDEIAKLAVLPDAEAQLTALKTRWQERAEGELLAKPLEIYYYKMAVEPAKGKDSQWSECQVYRLVLRCSRQPFAEDPSAPAPETSPTPSPADSPAPAAATSPR